MTASTLPAPTSLQPTVDEVTRRLLADVAAVLETLSTQLGVRLWLGVDTRDPSHQPQDLDGALATASAAVAATSQVAPVLGQRPTEHAATTAAAPAWRHEGSVWALTYDATTVRMPDAKGLADLAVLLSQPGREVAATELMGAAVEGGDLGPVIDTTARRAYERRIMELQEELEEAEDFADLARAERTRAELDQVIDTLTASMGLGGRSRRGGDNAERARSAVTRRIRDVIRRITDIHPSLGTHLTAAVRTGRWCAYDPLDDVVWTVRLNGTKS